jgi:hypothetical protein
MLRASSEGHQQVRDSSSARPFRASWPACRQHRSDMSRVHRSMQHLNAMHDAGIA